MNGKVSDRYAMPDLVSPITHVAHRHVSDACTMRAFGVAVT
jgi:hypothetical protein